jgi:uncharacterized peroxidase-related enzyme
MPHIDLPDGLPGILGPMAFRPETAGPLNALAEVLLRGEHTLSRGERELIAAYVSSLNDCFFCQSSHSAFAARQLDEGARLVEQVKADPDSAPITEKLRALLAIAGKVQQTGRAVRPEDIARAREHGASDVEIHDTVLIAAAFCMFNRYVDGLGTFAPAEPEAYDAMAATIVEHGYRNAVPAAA